MKWIVSIALLFLMSYDPAPLVTPDSNVPFDPNVEAIGKYRIWTDELLDTEEIVVYELNGQDVTLTSDILSIGEPYVHVDVNGVKISEWPWAFVSSDPNMYYANVEASDGNNVTVSTIVIKVDKDYPPIIGGCRSR